MGYNRETVKAIFSELGEVMFVLESDREYELHSGNVELQDDHIVGEGLMVDDDGDPEYVKVWFDYDVIEHHYTHKAL